MKRLLLLIIISLLITGCDQQNNDVAKTGEQVKDYEAEIKRLEDEVDKLEEALTLAENQEAVDASQYEYSVLSTQAHYLEAYEKGIYTILRRENKDNSNDWVDTLWYYSPTETKKLYESQGLSFRVSANQTYIAVVTGNQLVLIDQVNNTEATYPLETFSDEPGLQIQLMDWGRNDVLWLSLIAQYETEAYIKLEASALDVDLYPNRYVYTDDYAFNAKTGLMAYSDYPVMLDEIHLDDYLTSQVSTKLYLYDIERQKRKQIDIYTTNRFQPKWFSDEAFLYQRGQETRTYVHQDTFDKSNVPFELSKDNLLDQWQTIWDDLTQYEGPLTSGEIEVINQLFQPMFQSTEVEVNPLTCFFTSSYQEIDALDLEAFLRYFPYGEVPEDLPEYDGLRALAHWPFSNVEALEDMMVPIHRYPSSALEEVLGIYGGIRLKDLQGLKAEGVFYLQETDAFYNYTSDFAPGVFTCKQGHIEGGVITLYGTAADKQAYELVIVRDEGEYHIRSFTSY